MIRRLCALGVLAFVVGSRLRPARAAEGDGQGGTLSPPPALALQPTTVHRKTVGLVVGGAITFGLSWSLAALFGVFGHGSDCVENCDGHSAFFVPAVGPAIWAAGHPSAHGTPFFYALSGAETGGLVMLIIGLVGHDVPQGRVSERGPRLQLLPMLAGDSRGMTLATSW